MSGPEIFRLGGQASKADERFGESQGLVMFAPALFQLITGLSAPFDSAGRWAALIVGDRGFERLRRKTRKVFIG